MTSSSAVVGRLDGVRTLRTRATSRSVVSAYNISMPLPAQRSSSFEVTCLPL
jgi:hypothetical protein